MKSNAQLEAARKEMLSQIPELVKRIGETMGNDEEEGMLVIGDFVSKLSMLNFVLDDSGAPFEVVEEATQHAFENSIDRFFASMGESCDCQKCPKKYTCPNSTI